MPHVRLGDGAAVTCSLLFLLFLRRPVQNYRFLLAKSWVQAHFRPSCARCPRVQERSGTVVESRV